MHFDSQRGFHDNTNLARLGHIAAAAVVVPIKSMVVRAQISFLVMRPTTG
jgi:hypothetical protein